MGIFTRRRLRCQFAAVDGDRRTRDERRLVGREKHDGLGDLFGRSRALSGTPAIKPAFLSSVPVKRFSIPVSIGPGATALTRTPDPAASSAADFVSPSTACLLAVYTDAPGAADLAEG